MVDIAPARPICADLAAALIRDTDRHIFDNLHGFDLDLSRRHLGAQWMAEGGIFSHTRGRAAMDGDQLLGLQIGYDLAGLMNALEPHGKICAEVMTPAQRQHHDSWWGTYGMFNILDIPEETYYLQNLAVDPDLRGRGIGAILLEDALETARSAGYARLHLDVYDGNPSVRLYQRMGLEVIVETVVKPLEADGFPKHLRMEIGL